MTSKDNALLNMIQEQYTGYHPIMSLVHIAHAVSEPIIDEDTGEELSPGRPLATIGQQIDIHKTVAKYVEPELKSMEVKGNVHHDYGTLRVVMEQPEAYDEDGVLIEGAIGTEEGDYIPTRYTGEEEDADLEASVPVLENPVEEAKQKDILDSLLD